MFRVVNGTKAGKGGKQKMIESPKISITLKEKLQQTKLANLKTKDQNVTYYKKYKDPDICGLQEIH